MAFNAIDNTRVNAAKFPDDWYAAEVVAGKEIPYASIQAAKDAIPSAVRMKGRSCLILVDGLAKKYWWKDDLTNNGLIPYSEFVTPEQFGALGDGVTDDTLAFKKASDYGELTRCKVMCSNTTYVLDNLVIGRYVQFEGNSGNIYRFGPNASATGGTIFLHKSGSTNPMIDMAFAAAGLKNIFLNGNGNTGTTLKISNGFEVQLDTIRIAYGTGIGLDLDGSFNVSYKNVFVDNCGSETKPQVLLNSIPPRTINTLDWYGLTIERPYGGWALGIGIGTNIERTYPEFIKIINLHVEAPSDNGGVPNTNALIRIENARNISLVSPFILGGPGYLIEHNQTEPTLLDVLGGIQIIGGTLLGRNQSTGFQPDSLVHLIKGNYFYIGGGCIVDNYLLNAVVVESTYSGTVIVDPSVMMKRGSVRVLDNRTSGNPYRIDQKTLFNEDATFRGHIKSNDSITNLVTINTESGAGTAPPTPTLVAANDTKGQVLFGSGTNASSGAQFTITFSKPYTRTPVVILTAGNARTSTKDLYRSVNNNSFTVYFGSAPESSQATGNFQIDYLIIQ